jgi:hypothetical protein
MEETFKESVIEKIGQIEKQVVALSNNEVKEGEIEEQQKSLLMILKELKSSLSQLNNNVRTIQDAFGRMSDLSGKLDRCTHVLENPVDKKEHHIHHFRWPLGVAVGVSLLLVLAVSGLYVDHQKLQQYIANDTKYRSLKLIKNKGLEALLYAQDSTYLANPDMRKQVLEQEAARDKKLELLREAREKRREAGELERKAGTIEK